ncbi:hypothetical protein JCM19233_336 [Vibrio astriarenae]|nr:hypothetical protein JCM19233_336 [Vibrio sp. C7]
MHHSFMFYSPTFDHIGIVTDSVSRNFNSFRTYLVFIAPNIKQTPVTSMK